MTITEAIAEAAEFIYATLDHAAECELENQDDANFHCEIEHESGYRSHLKEIAEVLRQAAPTKGYLIGEYMADRHVRD